MRKLNYWLNWDKIDYENANIARLSLSYVVSFSDPLYFYRFFSQICLLGCTWLLVLITPLIKCDDSALWMSVLIKQITNWCWEEITNFTLFLCVHCWEATALIICTRLNYSEIAPPQARRFTYSIRTLSSWRRFISMFRRSASANNACNLEKYCRFSCQQSTSLS
jgi:hypothetical protein